MPPPRRIVRIKAKAPKPKPKPVKETEAEIMARLLKAAKTPVPRPPNNGGGGPPRPPAQPTPARPRDARNINDTLARRWEPSSEGTQQEQTQRSLEAARRADAEGHPKVRALGGAPRSRKPGRLVSDGNGGFKVVPTRSHLH